MNAYLLGLEEGNITFMCLAGSTYCECCWNLGKRLPELLEETVRITEAIKATNNKEFLYSQLLCHQAILNLLGKSENPVLLEGEIYKASEMIPVQEKAKNIVATATVYYTQMVVAYFMRDLAVARDNYDKLSTCIKNINSTIAIPYIFLVGSLILIEEVREYKIKNIRPVIEKVKKNQICLKKWADSAPMNFKAFYLLVEAELAALLKHNDKASELYEKAISLSSENRFIQVKALAYELTSRFNYNRGNDRLGWYYIKDAYQCYSIWGAAVKVRQLENEFLLLMKKETVGNKTKSVTLTEQFTSKEIMDKLDLITIMKASQAISGEIIMDRLLAKFIEIALENSGAQRVFLLLKDKDDYLLQAKGEVINTSTEIAVLQGTSCNKIEDLPHSIINFVRRKGNGVVLEDAVCSDKYSEDEYIKKSKIKSLLCIPISSKGEIIGILYLENSLVKGSFSQDRVSVLNMIALQFAISIENTMLYSKLDELVILI
jgi:tetratricopeptide (TPR) repeat protein